MRFIQGPLGGSRLFRHRRRRCHRSERPSAGFRISRCSSVTCGYSSAIEAVNLMGQKQGCGSFKISHVSEQAYIKTIRPTQNRGGTAGKTFRMLTCGSAPLNHGFKRMAYRQTNGAEECATRSPAALLFPAICAATSPNRGAQSRVVNANARQNPGTGCGRPDGR